MCCRNLNYYFSKKLSLNKHQDKLLFFNGGAVREWYDKLCWFLLKMLHIPRFHYTYTLCLYFTYTISLFHYPTALCLKVHLAQYITAPLTQCLLFQHPAVALPHALFNKHCFFTYQYSAHYLL